MAGSKQSEYVWIVAMRKPQFTHLIHRKCGYRRWSMSQPLDQAIRSQLSRWNARVDCRPYPTLLMVGYCGLLCSTHGWARKNHEKPWFLADFPMKSHKIPSVVHLLRCWFPTPVITQTRDCNPMWQLENPRKPRKWWPWMVSYPTQGLITFDYHGFPFFWSVGCVSHAIHLNQYVNRILQCWW